MDGMNMEKKRSPELRKPERRKPSILNDAAMVAGAALVGITLISDAKQMKTQYDQYQAEKAKKTGSQYTGKQRELPEPRKPGAEKVVTVQTPMGERKLVMPEIKFSKK